MVDRDHGLAQREADRVGKADAHQQRAGQPRTLRAGDAVEFVHRRARVAEHRARQRNYPPDVVDDVATTTKGQPVTIDALKNDSDEEKDPLTITKVVVLEGQGEAMVNADGAVLFTPAAEFSGKAVIEYIANDFRGGPEKAKITVTVTP